MAVISERVVFTVVKGKIVVLMAVTGKIMVFNSSNKQDFGSSNNVRQF